MCLHVRHGRTSNEIKFYRTFETEGERERERGGENEILSRKIAITRQQRAPRFRVSAVGMQNATGFVVNHKNGTVHFFFLRFRSVKK